jgi:hypothetical protein
MPNSITINLNSGSRPILKFGFLLRAFFILLIVIGVAMLGISFYKESVVGALICFIAAIVLFLAFFKILNAAFFSEQLIVTKDDITVIRKNISDSDKSVFRVDEIKYFGYADQHYTKHPMDNPIVDITGLATQEKELQYVIDEGKIRIETSAKDMKFGKNLASWDVDEVMDKIESFLGMKFTAPPVEPHNDSFVVDDDQDNDGSLLPDEEQEPYEELAGDEQNQPDTTKYTYEGDYGVLVIEQKNTVPSAEDKAFLNGRLAPTGKYQLAEKQFVMVSNGMIYAVRGFSNEF